MDSEYRIKIIDSGYKRELDVFIVRDIMVGGIRRTSIMRGDDEEIVIDGRAQKPSLSLSLEALQTFADALDKIGIKPQKGFIEGKLAATENHLADMRKLLKLP